MSKKMCYGCGRRLSEAQFEILDYDIVAEKNLHGTRCMECVNGSRDAAPDGFDDDESFDDTEQEVELLSRQLAGAAQMDLKILATFTAHKFKSKLGARAPASFPDFSKLQERAREIITREMGLSYPHKLELPPGNYIVIGESHGENVHHGLVKCVERMAEHFKASVIHIGHVVDRQKNVAAPMLAMPNLTVVAVADEIFHLSLYQEQHPGFVIVRDRVVIAGSVLIRNQHDRGDFTRTSIKNMRLNETGFDYIVVDSHMHEVHSLCKNHRQTQILSPGCMCEKHQHRKPRQIPPSGDSELLACSLNATFAGRRQDELNRYWENGVTLVCVSKEGAATVVNCRAKKIAQKFYVGYGGMLFSETGIVRADRVGLVVCDAHVANHDPEVLSIVDQVAKKLCPDYLVNLGDHWDNRSFNHHLMERGEVIFAQVANECGKGHEVLKKMAEWTSGERHIIIGNHGRFINDFTKKFPQLNSLLNFQVLSGAQQLGYIVTDVKNVIEIAGAKFFHGELKLWGSAGDRHQRIRDVMEVDSMFGHTHSPSCRRGCYAVGLLGLMDQDYNEPEASAWIHGFGTAASYGGEVFMCTVPIFRKRLRFMGVNFKPKHVSAWRVPEFEAEVIYRAKQSKVRKASLAK